MADSPSKESSEMAPEEQPLPYQNSQESNTEDEFVGNDNHNDETQGSNVTHLTIGSDAVEVVNFNSGCSETTGLDVLVEAAAASNDGEKAVGEEETEPSDEFATIVEEQQMDGSYKQVYPPLRRSGRETKCRTFLGEEESAASSPKKARAASSSKTTAQGNVKTTAKAKRAAASTKSTAKNLPKKAAAGNSAGKSTAMVKAKSSTKPAKSTAESTAAWRTST